MKGKHKVVVQNNKLHYEFAVKRNITVLQGDSATGKTTLIDMIRQNMNLGESSGVDVVCDVPCRVLEGRDWKIILSNLSGNIIFIDEGNRFVYTEEFAAAAKGSDNYFVIITRENLYNLPYSVEEIYGIHSSGKYQNTKKVYQEIYRIYSNIDNAHVKPDKVIVEDSNAGYEFFKDICDDANISCLSAGGKSNIFKLLKCISEGEICVIADGAAIGSEMSVLYNYASHRENIKLYLPESFEWLILQSGLIKGNELQQILSVPENYIDSKDFFSWEQFFAKLLVQATKDTYMQYRKSKLNPVYLHERNKQIIMSVIKGIDFN